MNTLINSLLIIISATLLVSASMATPLAEKYKENGNRYYARSEYMRAIEAYTKAVDTDPGYAAAYFNRGLAYYHSGLYYKSIVDFDKVLSLSPEDSSAYYSRGLAYEKTKQYKLAFSDINKAAELGDADATALVKTGRLQKKIMKTDDNKDKRNFDIRTTVTTFQKGDVEYDGTEGIYQKKEIFNNQGEKVKTIILRTAWYNSIYNINKTVTFFNPSGTILRKENFLTGKQLGSKEVVTYTPDGHVKEKILVNIY